MSRGHYAMTALHNHRLSHRLYHRLAPAAPSPSRRDFIKSLVLASGMSLIPGLSFAAISSATAAEKAYSGKLLVTLQLGGGLDVTSFCDPKLNTPGQPEINHWARTQGVQQAGNLHYAPFANNAAFFAKYCRSTLVINGVDSQTNSHTVGVLHNWSGRNTDGFPSLTALFAAIHQPELAMAYVNFGGFGATQGIITSTRTSSIDVLRNLVEPNRFQYNQATQFLADADVDRIKKLLASQQALQLQQSNLLPANQEQHQHYIDSLLKNGEISRFADYLPSEDKLQAIRTLTNSQRSSLHQQVQLALLAFKAGVSVAADLHEGGFDTHSNHAVNHALALGNVTDAIDYFWSYAEELGLAERLVLLIGTEFGRTPYFNASEGKDHWPIASTLVMQKSAPWANRMVGMTDAGHRALKINPSTLQIDEKGIILKPAHVHKALRRYLALESATITQRFPFADTEEVKLFG
jgi:uncharacterized protein (DUF1501 family)